MQSAENRKFKFIKGLLTITFENTFTENKDIQIIFQSESRKVVETEEIETTRKVLKPEKSLQ